MFVMYVALNGAWARGIGERRVAAPRSSASAASRTVCEAPRWAVARTIVDDPRYAAEITDIAPWALNDDPLRELTHRAVQWTGTEPQAPARTSSLTRRLGVMLRSRRR